MVREPGAYFLGAMVALRPDNDGRREVIDGQQRLTTLTCIAATLREFLEAVPEPQGEEVRGTASQFQGMIAHYFGGAWLPRLELSDPDIQEFFVFSCSRLRTMSARHDYWERNANALRLLELKTSPAPRIRRALEISWESVNSFLNEVQGEPERVNRLLSLCAICSECLVTLLIEAQNHATAYDLFESLNYRGMPLTQADLIKNEVIKGAPNADARESVVETWGTVKANVGSLEFLLPDFLHYSYLSRWESVKASALFDSVKSKVNAIGATVYADGLQEDSEALELLVRGDNTRWSRSTNEMLRDLSVVLNIKLAYVGLLAAYRAAANEQHRFEQYTNKIVNFAFRYIKVMEGDVAVLAKAMQEVAALIREDGSPEDVGARLRQDSPDARFIERFSTFGVNNAKLGYYVVYCLEKTKLSGTIPLEHGVEQHLEHIMPRTPRTSSWPDATLLKATDPDTFWEYAWRIGNLLPLTREINVAIKNFSIDRKISDPEGRDYSNCDLASPQEVENYLVDGQWTVESIVRRQTELAQQFAVASWPL